MFSAVSILRNRLPILQTPGVVSVVGFGNEPAPVVTHEIADLQPLCNGGRSVLRWPYLRVGKKVQHSRRRLRGIERFLLDLRKGRRIVVSVTLLQRSVAAEIEREDIEPVL